MGKLYDQILAAIERGDVLVSLHAEQRCDERGVTVWQLIASIDEARLVRERPSSQSNPSAIVRQGLDRWLRGRGDLGGGCRRAVTRS